MQIGRLHEYYLCTICRATDDIINTIPEFEPLKTRQPVRHKKVKNYRPNIVVAKYKRKKKQKKSIWFLPRDKTNFFEQTLKEALALPEEHHMWGSIVAMSWDEIIRGTKNWSDREKKLLNSKFKKASTCWSCTECNTLDLDKLKGGFTYCKGINQFYILVALF